jgi:hypothetical protein
VKGSYIIINGSCCWISRIIDVGRTSDGALLLVVQPQKTTHAAAAAGGGFTVNMAAATPDY